MKYKDIERTDYATGEIYQKIVTSFSPEDWVFDENGEIIGIWRIKEMSLKELREMYPESK